MTDQLIELGKLAGAAVALSTLVVLLARAGLGMFRTVRRLGRLTDEVLGDGDKIPGWGKRLAAIEADVVRVAGIEADVSSLKAKIAQVLGEVQPNGGGSMRDEVRRIAEATGATRDDGGQ